MVLLLQSFHKLCSNNRHGCKPSSSVSHLQAFNSKLSSSLNHLLLSVSHSKTLSFQWLLQLLQALPILHQSFAKLVVDLEHPVGKWGGDLVDGYLNYSLNLLEMLNSISFSLTQLAQSRLSLACALNSLAVSRLKPIGLARNYRGFENRGIVGDRTKGRSGEERAIGEALAIMEEICYRVCGTLISGCEGDSAAYFAMRKLAAGVAVPEFTALDAMIFELVSGKGSVPAEVAEVAEVNVAATEVVEGGGEEAAAEMRRRLERLEKAVEKLGKEVDGMFSEVLDGRSRLLDVFRQHKH